MSAAPDQHAPWRARLALDFAPCNARTVIARRRQYGPLAVQKAFYPEGPPAHVYLLHPPGGLVGGDELDITLTVAPGAQALVTTPASGKVYRSVGAAAQQRVHLQVAREATLEWMPQDTILFDGSALAARTTIELASGARLFARDIIALGRPAHGDHYACGELDQRLLVKRDDRALLEERLQLAAPSALLDAPWGLGGARVIGTLYASPAGGAVLARARALAAGALRVVATVVEDLLCLRVLADDATAVRDFLARAWACLRPLVAGRIACAPRVWRT